MRVNRYFVLGDDYDEEGEFDEASCPTMDLCSQCGYLHRDTAQLASEGDEQSVCALCGRSNDNEGRQQ